MDKHKETWKNAVDRNHTFKEINKLEAETRIDVDGRQKPPVSYTKNSLITKDRWLCG